MTLKVLEHVTMGSSCDHTGSKLSHDLSCDQVPDLAPSQSDNKSGDKECKHVLTHAYFCRCDLCYVHDKY